MNCSINFHWNDKVSIVHWLLETKVAPLNTKSTFSIQISFFRWERWKQISKMCVRQTGRSFPSPKHRNYSKWQGSSKCQIYLDKSHIWFSNFSITKVCPISDMMPWPQSVNDELRFHFKFSHCTCLTNLLHKQTPRSHWHSNIQQFYTFKLTFCRSAWLILFSFLLHMKPNNFYSYSTLPFIHRKLRNCVTYHHFQYVCHRNNTFYYPPCVKDGVHRVWPRLHRTRGDIQWHG